MIYVGIDPGQSGGIAALSHVGHYLGAWKMGDTEADTHRIFCEICDMDEWQHAYIERVHSMPRQGVSSSFKFGMSYGFLRGLLTANRIPFSEVSPQVWQKKLGCLSRGDKNITKARAQQLYPQVRITHATADALLIATYCFHVRVGAVPSTPAQLAEINEALYDV